MKTFATIVLLALLAIKGIAAGIDNIQADVRASATTYHQQAETAYNQE